MSRDDTSITQQWPVPPRLIKRRGSPAAALIVIALGLGLLSVAAGLVINRIANARTHQEASHDHR